ncbi:MAG: acylphosphatase [bacterium]|nr:acylphosphatase [bacterium]
MDQVKILVTGKVQGVLYRSFVSRYALNLGLTGWARNNTDGSVEVLAEGKKKDLEQLVLVAKSGPQLSKIEEVKIEWVKGEKEFGDFTGFNIV